MTSTVVPHGKFNAYWAFMLQKGDTTGTELCPTPVSNGEAPYKLSDRTTIVELEMQDENLEDPLQMETLRHLRGAPRPTKSPVASLAHLRWIHIVETRNFPVNTRSNRVQDIEIVKKSKYPKSTPLINTKSDVCVQVQVRGDSTQETLLHTQIFQVGELC
ncbi:hypothetical protein C8F01DRAFT_1231882 [Mycena amicta]|nr:hypothetical protein C8F01DRAFT_1231882 [Mycena amicta]